MVTDGGVRKVKIQKSGQSLINIEEVEVYDEYNVNRARDKTATQSTTYYGNTASWGPQKAVDGTKGESSYSHTADNDIGMWF